MGSVKIKKKPLSSCFTSSLSLVAIEEVVEDVEGSVMFLNIVLFCDNEREWLLHTHLQANSMSTSSYSYWTTNNL